MKKNTKDWIMYSSAMLMVISGVVLSFINFFIAGYIASSVLVYVSQALVYSGAIYGVAIYLKQNLDDYKTEASNSIANFITDKMKDKK